MSKRELIQGIDKLEEEMRNSAKLLDFENAVKYRDHLKTLREKLEEKSF
jgi:excinuclease UvrABC helicase subunit UvrB